MDILKKISKFESRRQRRLNTLYEYYIGRHGILKASKPDGKPNNRLVTNFPKNIVNNTIGYFLGKPITYKCEDDELSEQIQHITQYNDDAFHNIRLGKDLSVFGIAAELVYIDADGEIRYQKINPMNLIIGYTNDIEPVIEYAIRWYDVFDDDDQRIRYIEVYTDTDITYYTYDGNLCETETKQHFFHAVPVNVYRNNDDCIGDFEDVIPLIDAYNTMQSEGVNDYQSFADAVLLLKNIRADEEAVRDMRQKHILETYEDGDASWLVKQVNDAYVENIKDRIREDIYMSSNTVNMSDENFAQNASGVSIKHRLMNFENRISITERHFKQGLQRRFELVCNILNTKGGNFDYTLIELIFVRNLPANLADIGTMVQQLNGGTCVSKRTLMGQIPFIEDIERELEQIAEETEREAQYNMGNFGHNDDEE